MLALDKTIHEEQQKQFSTMRIAMMNRKIHKERLRKA